MPQLVMMLMVMVVSTMVSAALRTLAKRRADGRESSSLGQLVNKRDSNAILPLIYGTCRVGVNEVYIGISGPTHGQLRIIGALGEGPIHGIVRADGTVFTSTNTTFPSSNPPLLYLDGKLWTEYDVNYINCKFYAGTDDQTVCPLNTDIPAWTDPLRHTAYIYLVLAFSEDLWVGKPDVTLTVAGLKLYDPTADSIAHSDNPALVVYDMLTRPSSRGGMGLDNWHAAPPASERVDVDAIEDARAYCAAKGWGYNAPIDDDTFFADNLQLVLDCFRGDIVYSENVFKLKYRDLNYESSVMALTTADVTANDDGTSTLSLAPIADLFDLPNAVKARFINSEKKYLEDVYTLVDPDADLDTDTLKEVEVKLLGLNTLDQVQQMVNYLLERSRWGHRVEFSARDLCMKLEAMDLITMTHNTPGWTAQPLRVLSTGFDPATHTVSLECIEEDEDLYDDTCDPSELNSYTVTLPDPTATVPDVTGASISEEVYYYRGRSFTRLLVSFDPPDADGYPWWDYADVAVKIGDGDWRYMTKSRGNYLIDPAEEGETYYVRLRSVNIWGAKRPENACSVLQKTVVGQSDAPDDLSGLSASVNGDSVTLMATLLTDPDIEGYEVRLGDSWASGIFISFNKAPTIRLNGVRPGTHTFWMAAKNNSGVYSDSPSDVTVTVFVMPGFSEVDSWEWDYDGIGSHDNTQHTTYSGQDALICSHTSSVLTGTWTSPTYDLTSVQKVRMWCDLSGTLVAGDQTFDGVFSTTLKFSDIDASGELTFQEIFQPLAASQVQLVLYWSEDNVSWDSVGYFEVLSAEVEARYIKVDVTITDPTDDANYYLYALGMNAYSGPA